MEQQADKSQQQVSLLQRGWRNVREAGTLQLAATTLLVMLALLIGRFSWFLPNGESPTPFTNAAENALYDVRSYLTAEIIEQDDRILLVVFSDETLIKLGKRSPLDRGMLAAALRNLDAMGAKAIGIDILFDQPQDEDSDLIETLRSMQTPVSVAYANMHPT